MTYNESISSQAAHSNRLSIQVGFWSSFLVVVLFLVFTVCFAAIALTSPLFSWTTLDDYVTFARQHNQTFQHIARASMLAFGPVYVVLLNCIYDHTPQNKKLLVRIGVHFGIAFAVLTGIHYFIQLSAVHLSLLKGELQGLEQIVQANPISAVSAINMLGWTLFFGLSSLFVAPVFSTGRLERAIGIALLLNGLCCLLGGVGYIFDITVLIFFTINFGMGGAVLTASILLCIFYKRVDLSLISHENGR